MKPHSRIVPRGLVLSFSLILALPWLSAPLPQGAEFDVIADFDEVDADLGDGICLTASGYCTLRAAVMQANALPGHDVIHLSSALYPLTIAGAAEDDSITGDLDILETLTIDGVSMGMTAVDGSVLGDRMLHVLPGVTLNLTGVSFVYGDAGSESDGGGLLNENGIVTMVEASFQGNKARRGAGVVNLGEMTVQHSVIGFNTAAESAGGILNDGTLTIDASTVANNGVLAGPGGGIENHGTLVIRNSTVSQNRARNGAAGILNRSSATASINNTTINYNLVDPDGSGLASTGGILNEDGGWVQISNSILAINADDWSFPDADCMGSVVSGGYNLFGSLIDCTITGDTTGDLVGLDPLLSAYPTVDPVWTWGYPPLPGSPAIDAGNPAAPGSSDTACEPSDQRGIARPQGERCDIGAYEVEAPPPADTPTPMTTQTPTSTDTPSSTPTSTPTNTATSTPTDTPTPSPTPTPTTAPLFADGFESGDLSAWSSAQTDQGDLSVSSHAAIGGSYGLQAVLDDSRSIYVVDTTPAGETAYDARFYFDPTGVTMASGNDHVLLMALSSSGAVAFRIELRSLQGDTQVRASASRDGGGQFATPWTTLTRGPHFVEIGWHTASSVDAGDGALAFWVDGQPRGSSTTLDNDTRRVDSVRWGAVSGVDTATRGTYSFDAFASTRGVYIGADDSILLPSPTPAPDVIFADGFETGDVSAWSAVKSDGDLLVDSAAARVGAFGMETVIDDTIPVYVSDWSPSAEKDYRVRFVFDPNSLSMLEGRTHFIFQALTGSSKAVARVELRYKSGNYEIRSGLLTSDSRWLSTGWWYISDEPQTIEIRWWASPSPDAPEGGLTMWINQIQSETRGAVQNFGLQVDFVRLGVVAGVDAGTLGSMYFDAFDSHRETPIGLP